MLNLVERGDYGIGSALNRLQTAYIKVDGAPPCIVCAFDVGIGIVANHHRGGGIGTALLKGIVENATLGLGDSAVVAQHITVNQVGKSPEMSFCCCVP